MMIAPQQLIDRLYGRICISTLQVSIKTYFVGLSTMRQLPAFGVNMPT